MFTGSQEPVRSIVVIPLLGASSAFGGVYVTHNEPSSFAESKATIVEVSSLLQSLLLQGLVAPPQDWEQLVQQVRLLGFLPGVLFHASLSPSSGCGTFDGCVGTTQPMNSLAATTHQCNPSSSTIRSRCGVCGSLCSNCWAMLL
jgi:hypothetical protein